jgi:hypothetical protein
VDWLWNSISARLRPSSRRGAAVAEDVSDGPAPAAVEMAADGTNPLHRLFDAWRLPYRETRGEVTARVGLSRDPFYSGDALVLSEAVPLAGAMAPWTASAFERIPPQYPISRFSALVWFEDDAQTNLRRTDEAIAARIGPAPIGRRWNTLVGAWRCGLAEIGLIAFPPAWQSHGLQNDAHEREPRLRTACRVNVATGFIAPLSARERAWVESFRPVDFAGSAGLARIANAGASAPAETELEYARETAALPPGTQSSLGLSADAGALIVVSNQLYVIAREDLLHLEVVRLTPAKGGGGSMLYAHCRTQAPGADSKSIALAQASDPDGMNALAGELGRRLGCGVEIGPYYPDV